MTFPYMTADEKNGWKNAWQMNERCLCPSSTQNPKALFLAMRFSAYRPSVLALSSSFPGFFCVFQ